MTPPETLKAAAEIYAERNKLYGDNYKRFGPIMALLFPEGLNTKTPEDQNRLGIFVQMVSKMTRYAENFSRGGHNDSLDDLIVYSAMLKELDGEAKTKTEPVQHHKFQLGDFSWKEWKYWTDGGYLKDDERDAINIMIESEVKREPLWGEIDEMIKHYLKYKFAYPNNSLLQWARFRQAQVPF